jgi:hypothetical protein
VAELGSRRNETGLEPVGYNSHHVHLENKKVLVPLQLVNKLMGRLTWDRLNLFKFLENLDSKFVHIQQNINETAEEKRTKGEKSY